MAIFTQLVTEGILDIFDKKEEKESSKSELSSSEIAKRKSVYAKACAVIKKEWGAIKDKPLKRSIHIAQGYDTEAFFNGEENSIIVLEYNLWDYSKDARNDKVNTEHWDKLLKFIKQCNGKLVKMDCKIRNERGGDWDSGGIELVYPIDKD